jgi:GDPmannose 4,6-dehydratase
VKRALITGITGQDGSYLAELLLAKGYQVHGIIRRASTFNTHRIDHIYEEPHAEGQRLYLHYGDLLESESLARIIRTTQPDEIYNLGAQSHVRVSFDLPVYTADVDYLGTLRLLEAIRNSADKPVRFYQASSSEMYGGVSDKPLSEDSPFHPRSPYGVAKVASYWQTINYREAYGLFAANGVLFNHESPRRGETFVTRKITRGLALILAGRDKHVYLGNLDARRDWGYAADYVEGIWRVLQHHEPDDFVLAKGETHSVRSFLHLCCSLIDMDPEDVVRIDPRYYRPSEVDVLLGDASKAERLLGWKATTTLEQLAALMLHHDLTQMGLDPERYPRLHDALPSTAAA